MGTAGTYISGDIAADTQSCDVRRELLSVNGSPDLAQLREALLKTSEARTYMTLALAPQELAQRREYAFLGVTAANNAVASLPGDAGERIESLEFPTDQQLLSLPHMVALTEQVNRLDVAQLVQTFKVHDKNFSERLSELSQCDRLAGIGAAIGAMAMLLSLLSVILIALKEWHQRTEGTPHKQEEASEV